MLFQTAKLEFKNVNKKLQWIGWVLDWSKKQQHLRQGKWPQPSGVHLYFEHNYFYVYTFMESCQVRFHSSLTVKSYTGLLEYIDQWENISQHVLGF